jgi:hypothetical protein
MRDSGTCAHDGDKKKKFFIKNIYFLPGTDKFTTKTLFFYFFLTVIKSRLFAQSRKLLCIPGQRMCDMELGSLY